MPATPAYDMTNEEPTFRYVNNDNDVEGVVYRDVTHTEGAMGYSRVATTGDHPSPPPAGALCCNNSACTRSDSLKISKGNGCKWWWALFLTICLVFSLLANAILGTLYITGHCDRSKLHGHATNRPVLSQPTPAPITQATPPPQNQETGKCGCLDYQKHTFAAIKAQVDKLATKQANNTIVYYKQSTDTKLQGVRYDSSTGRFIIDTQGYYRISSQIFVDIRSGNVKNFNHCIMRNSDELICTRHRHGDDWAGPSNAVEPLVELKSGENISVKLNTIDFIYYENHSQITIFKLGCS